MFSRRDMERDSRRRTGMLALALLLTLAALAASVGPPVAAQGQTPPGWQAEIYSNLSVDNPLGGITPSILLLVVVEAAICGTATVLLAALGLLLWRSLRPQPAVAWVPVAGAPPPAAWLLIASPLGSFPPLIIPPNGLTIGRTTANQLAINDVQVSRCHARIDFINGVWLVTDLGSANGTLVNGVRIKRQPLRNGDRITIGQTTLTVRAISHG